MYQRSSASQSVLLAVVEGISGTDANPTAINAMRVFDLKVSPMEGQAVESKIAQPWHGGKSSQMAGVHRKATFGVELAGAGTAGATPAYDPLLRMAKMAGTTVTGLATVQTGPATPVTTPAPPTGTWTYAKSAAYTGRYRRIVTIECTAGGGSGVAAAKISAPQIGGGAVAGGADAYLATGVTITDATPVALPDGAAIVPTIGTPWVVGDKWTLTLTPAQRYYTPVSEAPESCTLYCYADGGRLYKLTGTRANADLKIAGSSIPELTFEATGLWSPVEPGDMAAIRAAIDWSSWADADVSESRVIPLASLHGFEPAIKELSIKLDNKTTYRPLANDQYVSQANHDWSGSITYDTPPLTTFDADVLIKPSSGKPPLGALELRHGTVPGRSIHLYSDVCQLNKHTLADDQDVMQSQVEFGFKPRRGGDDLIIAFL